MVKFGRRLVSERHEEWAEYYIDYKVRLFKTRGRNDAAFSASFRRIRGLTTASHRPHLLTRPTRARRA